MYVVLCTLIWDFEKGWYWFEKHMCVGDGFAVHTSGFLCLHPLSIRVEAQ